MMTTDIEKLLTDFEILPKAIRQPTYLELCRYPYNRFEEICSRLLCFYLSPQKEHGLQDLFLRSLFEILEPQKEIQFKFDKVIVINEENAEGKRLDILIKSDNFVIGIENKITAGLYNPLDIYNNRIALYNDNIYRIVLSLRKISSQEELLLLKENSFTNITYSEYFKQIKNNLEKYKNSNTKYLTFVNDFIQTIENMDGKNILNPQLTEYFYNNSERIDEIVELYNEFNNRIFAAQVEKISYLRNRISELTNCEWWAFEGWDLGFAEFNPNKPKIGIEAYFETTKGNPLGKFIVKITTWSLQDWNPYEKIVLQAFPNKELEKIDNRAILTVERILNYDEELILKTLTSIHEYLKTITRD